MGEPLQLGLDSLDLVAEKDAIRRQLADQTRDLFFGLGQVAEQKPRKDQIGGPSGKGRERHVVLNELDPRPGPCLRVLEEALRSIETDHPLGPGQRRYGLGRVTRAAAQIERQPRPPRRRLLQKRSHRRLEHTRQQREPLGGELAIPEAVGAILCHDGKGSRTARRTCPGARHWDVAGWDIVRSGHVLVPGTRGPKKPVDSIVVPMSTVARLTALSTAAEHELRHGILPFWAEQTVDREQGGFYGWVSNDLKVDREAPKGSVLNARILWTFSAAFRVWPDPLYRELADRAYAYLLEHFWDEKHSGLVWMVDHKGTFLDARKQTYGQAFGVYAFSEYFRATGIRESLERATSIFESIEAHTFEPEHGGYVEALAQDWSPLEDMRLSAIDLNVPYSQNTHLHLLEAYAALLRAWRSCQGDTGSSLEPMLRERLRALWEILAFRIRDEKTNRLILFQDRDWKPLSDAISHGHDIEASWLLCEAADVLGDTTISERTETIGLAMADGVLAEGFDHVHGGVSDAIDHHSPVLGKEWWPQAEAVVGFLNAFELTGREDYLEAALASWHFIEQFVVDRTYGEWYYRVSPEGRPELDLPKASPWKCPYHNARAALETIERVQRLCNR